MKAEGLRAMGKRELAKVGVVERLGVV